jgi:hypothetical protein
MMKALPPLLVALAGAVVAYLMLVVHPLVGLVVVLPLGYGWWQLREAKRLTATDPVGALDKFEAAQALPYSLALAASAALIFAAVWLTPPEPPSEEEIAEGATVDPLLPYIGEILKAVAGAISAFLTAAFIKASEEPDSWVAGTVEEHFKSVFKGKFAAGTTARDALLSPTFANEGWSKKGRTKRAEAIAQALQP